MQVSYVDDCRDDDGKATHLIGETGGGYLAVFTRQVAARVPVPSTRRCHWTVSVNHGRRVNVTWRVYPQPVRYTPSGVSLPLDGGRRKGGESSACSLRLVFIESGHDPVHWTCHGHDTLSLNRAAQVCDVHIATTYATVFSTRCNIYISRLCYDVSVRLSVCL